MNIHSNISQDKQVARNFYRERIDVLRSRVKLLSGKDKLLLTMYLEKGNSFRQMAQLAGVNETIIARRIYKVMRRLADGLYITCLQNRSRFNAEQMTIAKDHFLAGLSVRKLAQKRKLTYYRARLVIKQIERIIADIRQEKTPAMQ